MRKKFTNTLVKIVVCACLGGHIFPAYAASHDELIGRLRQAQPAVSGSNGAEALFAMSRLEWPQALPTCERDESDCLAFARQYLDAWQALSDEEKAPWLVQDETTANLLQYDYFRYPFYIDSDLPPYLNLLKQKSINAYRFVDGEIQIALRNTCRHATLGLRIIKSHNSLIDSMMGAALVTQNITLLAEMLAENPAGIPLPDDCTALVIQPAETLALCPLMYSEWQFSEDAIKWESNVGESAWENVLLKYLLGQSLNELLHNYSSHCDDATLESIRRDEVPAEPPISTLCRFNPLCMITDYKTYQARLLNVNRHLNALDILQHPDKTAPDYIVRQDQQLILTLHPFRREAEDVPPPTVSLPLPGSRLP